MRIQRTYYEVLGLPRTASANEIKLKYHDLARQFHPDRAKDKVLAERIFVQINLAYRTLMDADKRAVYDSSLFDNAAPQAAPSTNKPQAANTNSTAYTAPRTSSQPTTGPVTRPDAQPAPRTTPTPRPQLNVFEAMNKASTAYMGGDRITAHKLCMDVLKADPKNSEAHSLAGDIYADQGKRQEAVTEYRLAAQQAPSRLLTEKINRMESLIHQHANNHNGSGSNTQSRSDRPHERPQVAPTKTEAPKKSNLFDRLIGR